jgi:DNA-binding beta-propeller fold protein YncE
VAVAVAGGSAWVASTASTRLARVEASTMRRRRGSLVGRGASDLVARDGVLWVAAALANAVVPLRADTGRPAGGPIRLAGQPRVIDSGEGAIWVGERFEPGPDRLVRVDPVTRAITARGSFPGRLDDLAAGLGAIWVLAEDEGRDRLSQVEPGSGRVLRQLEVGPDARQVDAGAGAVWVTNHGDNTVARVNPRTGEVVTIGVPSKPYGLSVRPDGVWVACYGDQSVVRIDPATRRVAGAPVFVGINPIGIDAGPRHVWVTAAADNAVTRVDAG